MVTRPAYRGRPTSKLIHQQRWHHHGKGVFYWEPAWLPTPGATWATKAGMKYNNDDWKEGNARENQALFDCSAMCSLDQGIQLTRFQPIGRPAMAGAPSF